MDFERSIVLKVSDKTRGALNKIRALQNRITKATEKAAKVTRSVAKANAKVEQVLKRVGRAYAKATAKAKVFFSKSIQSGKRLAGVLAKIGAASAAAIAAGSIKVGTDIRRDAGRATSLGLDINEFRKLREYLVRASDGLFDSDKAEDFIRDIAERQQEAREEQARAVRDGKTKEEATGAAVDGLKSFGILGSVDKGLLAFFDDLIAAARKNKNAGFIGREVGGGDGDALVAITSKTKGQENKIASDINSTLTDIDPKDVENAKGLGTALANLRTTIKSLFEKVMIPLLPEVTATLDKVQASVKGFSENENVKAFVARISEIVAAFVDASAQFVSSGGASKAIDVLASFGKAIGFISKIIYYAGKVFFDIGYQIASDIDRVFSIVKLITEKLVNSVRAVGRFLGFGKDASNVLPKTSVVSTPTGRTGNPREAYINELNKRLAADENVAEKANKAATANENLAIKTNQTIAAMDTLIRNLGRPLPQTGFGGGVFDLGAEPSP